MNNCLSIDEVYKRLDNIWKPKFFRSTKVIRFVDWLHRDRISLKRILRISVHDECTGLIVVSIWYLSRRNREYYSAYLCRK